MSENMVSQGRIEHFFLGAGALVSCSTSAPINHIVVVVFFLQNTSRIRKPQVISEGGGVRTPCTLSLDPPLYLLMWKQRSPLLWLHNKSRLLQQKKWSEMVWHCIGVYITIELYMLAWRNEFFLCFVSPCGHVKSSISWNEYKKKWTSFVIYFFNDSYLSKNLLTCSKTNQTHLSDCTKAEMSFFPVRFHYYILQVNAHFPNFV